MEKIFFESWDSIIRTAVITVIAYSCLIILLRTSGKRTLSKMNAFDFIVTIALGSTLATVILSKQVVLADGILALMLLISLQFVITFLSARHKKFSNLVKSEPQLLFCNGRLLHKVMLKERIAEDEIYAALRKKGIGSVNETDAIILETDGTLTVVKNIPSLNEEPLKSVEKPGDLQ